MLKRSVSRREFLRLTGVSVAATTALAACPPAAVVEEPVVDAVAPAPDMVTISFMGWGGPEEDEGVRAAITVFEEENPGIRVTWLHTPDNYAERFLANVAAGTPPDTAFIGSSDFRTYAREDLLLDITDYLEADPLLGQEDYFIQPQEYERCTMNGRWYGIGSCWVAPHIYYNADIFAEEGITPPSNDPDEVWTWDHFVEVARALTRDANGNHPGDPGFDIGNVERWGVHWPTWWIPLHSAVTSNGGDYIDLETQFLVLDQPPAVEAIQRIADLMLVHQVMPQATAMEALGMTNTQMLETGRMAMAIDGSWALAWMHQIEATLGTACLPKMVEPATNIQAHLHSALAATNHPQESWEWVRFLATPFYQTQFLRIGLWLPSQTALQTPDGLETWITEGVHPPGYEKIATEYISRYGRVLYMPPGWPRADSIITPALDAVWVGDATAEEALSMAVPEANDILAAELTRN